MRNQNEGFAEAVNKIEGILQYRMQIFAIC